MFVYDLGFSVMVHSGTLEKSQSMRSLLMRLKFHSMRVGLVGGCEERN